MDQQEQWRAVDRYLAGLLVRADEGLDAALSASASAGLPEHQVTAGEGKLLHILARMAGARRILEIGTLGGYSTIWLGRALPHDGSLITLEAEAKHAEVARANVERAGLGGVVQVIVGPALQTLPRVADEGGGPFDLIFIDADKANNAEYFAWALRLSRRGTVIVADNVVRGGAVIDDASDDVTVRGVRRFMETLAAEPRVTATAIQTVGGKGYDGFAIALVTGDF